jgi:CHAD domain-containing protein
MPGSEFLPPDRTTLDSAGDMLAASLPLETRAERDADRTYFDSFDGLARAAGLSVQYEAGRLSLVERDTGFERAGASMSPPARPLLVLELEPGPLRDALRPLLDVRALLPLVHVHSRSRAMSLLDGERKTVVRMMLEEPQVVLSASDHIALRPRLRLSAVRGYDRELEQLREELRGPLGFTAAEQPLVDEAVLAAGGVPAGIQTRVEVALAPEQRADAAAAAVLRALLEVMRANLDGTIADIDSEFLHDFRVSVRRSRSIQREFKTVFPPAELERFRAEFRWLQQVTGDSRDLDVYVLEFGAMRKHVPEAMQPDLDALLAVLEARRLRAHEEMVEGLRSQRAMQLLREWDAFLEALVDIPVEDRPGAQQPARELAAARITKVYRRMVKMGSSISADSPPEEFHELRKRGKELRYLLELFGAPLFPEEVVKPMIKTLKGLQDVLGRHQDREVQMDSLRSLSDEVASRPGGPAALMAMGVLVERLAEDEQQAREEFAQAFSSFSSPSQRERMKETFS